MTDGFEHYAIYWVPDRSDALGRFGLDWHGWCPEAGERVPRRAGRAVSHDIAAINRNSWRHGLHGVIAAPVSVRSSPAHWLIERELEDLAESSIAFPLPRLQLAVIGGRVALVPAEDAPTLSALIARVDDAMAPLQTATARTVTPPPARSAARVDLAGLAEAPALGLGRFVVPLTDPLPSRTALSVMAELAPVLEPLLARPRWLRDIALMGDPGSGRPLLVLQRYALRRPAMPDRPSPLPCHGPRVLAPLLTDRQAEADSAL